MSERFSDEVLYDALDAATAGWGDGGNSPLRRDKHTLKYVKAMRAVLDGYLAAQASGLRAGHEFNLGNGRVVRVMAARDHVSVCRDSRGRVAVRNVLTHRLSYMQESDIHRAARKAASDGSQR